MASGQPGPGGDLSVTTDPAHFPDNYSKLMKRTLPIMIVYNGTAASEEYSTDIDVGMCEGFTVYALNSSGDWNVQFSPNPNNPNSGWVDAAGSDKTGDTYLATTSRHPHMRVVLRAGFTGVVWVYRKYATY